MAGQEHPIRREGFTRLQELQAEHIGFVSDEHRARRRQIPSYPIDNVAPEVVSDRDDGVYVEAEPREGGYRVHVTIADVAAHVRPGTPLAEAAWRRAFTLYAPDAVGNDSMFPNGPLQRLEEKMSLEHNRERLGLTVSITLDQHFKPVHTSFLPVITHPDNSSYSQAQERMQRDPQFQLMSEIAQGVKKYYFGGHEVPLEEIFSHRTMRRLKNQPEQLQAMEMVATYMLLANNCTAEFASKTNLPFLYRNFDETADAAHATYGTAPVRHTALERMGLKGAYCHFTSPIRRAPDYFNAVMIHYAIDIVTDLENRLSTEFSIRDPNVLKALHSQLWKQAPEFLHIASDNLKPAVRQRALIQKHLIHAMQEVMATLPPDIESRMKTLVQMWAMKSPPLSRKQLQGYAEHMNALARSPEIRAIERANEKYDKSIERIETVQASEKESLAHLSSERFSSFLRAAAVTGNLPRNLFEEARSRIQNGNYNMNTDGFTIFIEAAYPGVSRWTALKGLIATELKKDPSLVDNMLGRLKKHVAPATIEPRESAIYDALRDGDREKARTPVIIYAMEGADMPPLGPPFSSVGHDRRAARSHAQYSFLEHYAFGQLQPVEQSVIPSILYAELEVEGAVKRELLERMTEKIGATLEFHEAETNAGRVIQTIRAQGGELREPIVVQADEATEREAYETAMRRMLRDERFKLAVSRDEQIAREVTNPQSELEALIKERGGEIEFLRQPKTQGPHGATITITLSEKSTKFVGEGPNLDRAERAAAMQAMQSLGWQTDGARHNPGVKSWVTEGSRPPPGEGRHYHGK